MPDAKKMCKMTIMEKDPRDIAAGKRLAEARLRAGFKNARRAALENGWSYHSYVQHENGTRGIANMAAIYAKGFGVSEAWLLTGEGTMHPTEISIDKCLDRIPTDQRDKLARVILAFTNLLIENYCCEEGDDERESGRHFMG